MKMTKTELLRLKTLKAKTEADLSAEEAEELANLVSKAAQAKINLKSLDKAIEECEDDDDDDGEMDEAKVKSIVTEAMKSVMAGNKSANAEDIAEAVTKSLAAQQISEDKIRSIVGDAITAHSKSASRMEFPVDQGGDITFPIEHRGGNLTVAQKQLLNLTLMHAPPHIELATKRPTGLNDGIPDSLQRRCKAAIAQVTEAIKVAGAKAVSVGTVGAYSNGAFGGSLGALATVDLSTDLQMRLYLNSDLASALMAREIQMPTDPFKLPIKTVRTPFSLGAEPLNRTDYDGYVSGNTPTLSQILLDAKKMVGIASYTYEADEDAIIAILPMLQADLGEGAAASFESAVINGDSDGTHQDTGKSFTATSVESAYDGFRKHALAVGASSWASGGLSLDNFMALRGMMHKYGTNPADLIIVVDPIAYIKLQAEAEAFRYDVRGTTDIPANTGRLPTFNGIKVVVSEQMYPLVTTGGIFSSTGGDNVARQLLLINTTQYLVGVRRGFTVEVVQDPRVQTNFVVASFRRAFVAKEAASASIPHTVVGVNWT
jgi:hypothetical protein